MQREHIVLPLEEDSKPAPAYFHNQLARLGRLTGDAKEPTLFVRSLAPGAEEVPLPTTLKRGRTAMSEGGRDPSALQRWHDKRQKLLIVLQPHAQLRSTLGFGCSARGAWLFSHAWPTFCVPQLAARGPQASV